MVGVRSGILPALCSQASCCCLQGCQARQPHQTDGGPGFPSGSLC